LSLTLDQPGFGEWPPLRTENFVWKNLTILRAFDTSWVDAGIIMHDGASQHASDLDHSDEYSTI